MKKYLGKLLVGCFLLFSVVSFSFSEEVSIKERKAEVKRLAGELEAKIRPGCKIACQALADRLASYGELSVSEFIRLFIDDNHSKQDWGEYGLVKLKYTDSIDTLEKKYKADKKVGKVNYRVIDMVGKIGGQKAEAFLTGVVKAKDQDALLAASVLLELKGHDKESEDMLLESFKSRNRGVRLALKSASLLRNRRGGVIEGAVSVLADPKMSEWNWIDELSSASEILVKTEYERADEELIKAFSLQRSASAKISILKNIVKLKSQKSKYFLDDLKKKSGQNPESYLNVEMKRIISDGEDNVSKQF